MAYIWLGRLEKKEFQETRTYIDKSTHYHDNRSVTIIDKDKTARTVNK